MLADPLPPPAERCPVGKLVITLLSALPARGQAVPGEQAFRVCSRLSSSGPGYGSRPHPALTPQPGGAARLALCSRPAGPAPGLSMPSAAASAARSGFSRQEYWSGYPFPSPRDFPNPGMEQRSPALQADSLLTEPGGKPLFYCEYNVSFCLF